jgi:hypothetical protein
LVAGRHYEQAGEAMKLLGGDSAVFKSAMSSLSFKKSDTAFDWTFYNGDAGVSSGYEVVELNKSAKIWAANVGNDGGLIVASKLLMLPPGTYQFETTAQSPSPEHLTDFKWTVRCENSGDTLAQSTTLSENGPIVLPFSVPNERCEAFYIRLYTVPRDRLDRSDVSYFDPTIRSMAAKKVTPQ